MRRMVHDIARRKTYFDSTGRTNTLLRPNEKGLLNGVQPSLEPSACQYGL